tara:strand:+ start:1528 stop:2295 length:768 start_codon:yes stop_codon:yes gene_type:complete
MSLYILVPLLVLAVGMLIGLVRAFYRPRGLSQKEVQDWIKAEHEADAASDQAEADAAQKTQAIDEQTEATVQGHRQRTKVNNAKLDQVRTDAQAEDELQKALDRYDVRHGRSKGDLLNSLALFLLPTLFLLQACTMAHGAAGDSQPQYFKIKRTTWNRTLRTLNDCDEQLSTCKTRRTADKKKAKVQCDRRVAQERSKLNACRKQRGILQIRGTPSTMVRDVAIGVLAAYGLAATITALLAVFKPDLFQFARGGT